MCISKQNECLQKYTHDIDLCMPPVCTAKEPIMPATVQALSVPGSESAMFVARKSEHDTSTDLQQSNLHSLYCIEKFSLQRVSPSCTGPSSMSVSLAVGSHLMCGSIANAYI